MRIHGTLRITKGHINRAIKENEEQKKKYNKDFICYCVVAQALLDMFPDMKVSVGYQAAKLYDRETFDKWEDSPVRGVISFKDVDAVKKITEQPSDQLHKVKPTTLGFVAELFEKPISYDDASNVILKMENNQ